MNEPHPEPDRRVHLAMGVLFTLTGLTIVAAVVGAWPFDEAIPVNGPRWLGLAGGAIFALAGVAVAAQSTPWGPFVGTLSGVGIVGAFAAVFNWFAFGEGARRCTGGVGLPFVSWGGEMGDLSCRLGFGYAAIVLNGIVLLAVGHALKQALSESTSTRLIVQAGEWVVLVAVVPLILVALLVSLVTPGRGEGRTGTD